MTVRRIPLLAAALAVASAGLLGLGSPSQADDAGISGGVESLLELSLDGTVSGGLAATVTATESRTRLSLSQGRTKRRLGVFAGPVTGDRQVTPVDRRRGQPDITITYGLQGP